MGSNDSFSAFIKTTVITVFIFIPLILLDVFVIWDLIANLIPDDNLLAALPAVVFVAVIDIIPIFATTPALSKLLYGVYPEGSDERKKQTQLVKISIALFVLGVVGNLVMSLFYPERFIPFGGIEDGAQDNTKMLSIIFGLVPFVTTLASCLISFLTSGDQYVKEAIRSNSQAIDEQRRKNAKCDAIDVLMDNLRDYINQIRDCVNSYNESLPILRDECWLEEENRKNMANANLRTDALEKLDKLYRDGDAIFRRERLIGTSGCQAWQSLYKSATEELEKVFDVVSQK